MSKIKTKIKIPTLVDNTLYLQTIELQSTKAAIASLQAKADSLKEAIESKIADVVEEGKTNVANDSETMLMPTYQLNLVHSSGRRTIQQDRLLERGVSPEVIDYATDLGKDFTSLRIKENKNEEAA